MKRIIERRDFLSLLLTNGHPAVGINNNVAHLPACELKSLLVAISAECSGKRSVSSLGSFKDIQKEDVVYEQPRERARRSMNNNNHHSMLRFVERILESRYANNNDRNTANDKHAHFLENELQSYFGTNEAFFRAEEDILCLVFDLAYDAIRSVACVDISNDTISPSQLKSIFDTIHQRDIVDTSLRIIDRVFHVDKQERRKRDRLRQSMMNRKSRSNQCTITNKRQKYAHLLQTNVKERSQQNSASLSERESLVEKRLPKEWEWLVKFRSKYSSITDTNVDTETIQLNANRKSNDDVGPSQEENHVMSKSQSSQEFVILRRKYESMDDISLSSSESDQEMEVDNVEEVADPDPLLSPQNTGSSSAPTTEGATSDTGATPETNVVDNEASLSPIDELDKESRELRTTLLDLPSGELSSVQIIGQVTDTLVSLLNRYSDLNGTTGINQCGDIIAGNSCDSSANDKFPLNEEIVTSLIKSYLTSATGALRAKALMEAFVLPLVLEMNPVTTTTDSKQQKPASRSLTSLIVTLARDRPMECVHGILAPSMVPPSTNATDDWEPSRFQCELISRVLRAGRDSLSSQAIAQLVEKLLPTDAGSTGVKWTDNTMPLMTTCLNRRPPLSEVVITRMADEIIDVLSPNKCNSMEKNMKFATLFNALVSKYGPQLKTGNKVDPLIEAVSRLKTFMSKTVTASLKKLK